MHSLAFVLIALGFIGYGAVSAVLERSIVSAPMVFLGFGLLLSPQVLGLADYAQIGVGGETLVEVTLALVLFSDAVRIDLRSLRQESAVPVRLLALGLPLTLLLGFGAGFLPGLGLGWQEAGLLAAMVAATDAALGRAVVTDRRLPQRIAHGLNVESGLNDGVAVPFVLVFLGLAAATPAEQQAGLAHVMARQIGLGALGGVAAGLVGGTVLAYADRRGWVDGAWRQIITLATALLAFSVASELGGSGLGGAPYRSLRRLVRQPRAPAGPQRGGAGGRAAGAQAGEAGLVGRTGRGRRFSGSCCGVSTLLAPRRRPSCCCGRVHR